MINDLISIQGPSEAEKRYSFAPLENTGITGNLQIGNQPQPANADKSAARAERMETAKEVGMYVLLALLFIAAVYGIKKIT